MFFYKRACSMLVLLIAISQVYSQILNEPIGTENNCFNGVVDGNCSQPTERAFVTKVNTGVKLKSSYPINCSLVWTPSIAEECCQLEETDCNGQYQAIATDPYVFHKDCIGKYQCIQRPAARMDTLYHTHCNQTLYPPQTSYLDIEYLCIDVSKIVSINGDPKNNDGQGSTLYLWSGDSSTYLPLSTMNHECSVETDCDDTINIISVDFRFATDDANMTCIPEKLLTIFDNGQSTAFDCSDNNNFTIQQMYTSVSNYFTLSLNNVVDGGHLWLAFQSTSNGNLTVDCKTPNKRRICEESTTMVETTTETITTTFEMSTNIPTKETMSVSTQETITTTVDNPTNSGTTITDDPGKSSSSLWIIIGIVVGGLMFLAIVCVIIYWKRCRNQQQDGKLLGEKNPESEETSDSLVGGNNLHSRPPTRHFLGGVRINPQLIEKPSQDNLSTVGSSIINERQSGEIIDNNISNEDKKSTSHIIDDTGNEKTSITLTNRVNILPSINHISSGGANIIEENELNTKKKKKKKKRKVDIEEKLDEITEIAKKKKKKKRQKKVNETIDENADCIDDPERKKKKTKRRRNLYDDADHIDEHETNDIDTHEVNNYIESDNAVGVKEENKQRKKKKKRKSKKLRHDDKEGECKLEDDETQVGKVTMEQENLNDNST